MPTPIDNLIDSGPSDGKELLREIEHESTDELKIPVDAFEKAKEGDSNVLPLDPKTKKIVEEEEKAADEKEKLEKADEKDGDDSSSDTSKEQGDKKINKLETKEPETKTEEKQDSSDDSLIHLELAITPRQAGFFKKMDKAAREFVIHELKQRQTKITELSAANKELLEKRTTERKGDGSDLPENWYENDTALYITPEYNSVATKLSRVEQLRNHYRNQKIAIAEGENWEEVSLNEKGEYVKQMMKPNSAATAHVDDILQKLNSAEVLLKQEASTIEQNFKTNHIRNREQVVKLEDQYFPQYKDPKILEKNEHYQAILKLGEKFGIKKDRLFGVTAKMFVLTQETFAKLEALEDELNTLKAAQAKTTTKKNGPTGDEINHGGGKKSSGDPDEEQVPLDSFEKYKNRD